VRSPAPADPPHRSHPHCCFAAAAAAAAFARPHCTPACADYYRTPDDLAALASTYDGYNRTYPPVFVGEFAANGAKLATLQAALAEAAFMLGFEHNADVVHASSFAPLFANTNYEGWVYNLVQFNATASFRIPGWYAQAMLIEAVRACGGPGRASTVELASANLTKVVAITGADALVLQVVNYGDVPFATDVSISGLLGGAGGVGKRVICPHAAVRTLTAPDPQTVNDLEHPRRVVPVNSSFANAGEAFALSVAPWSLTTVQLRIATDAASCK
jgi:alpha-N-arabinofuranosidase